jgi:acetyltransferase
MTQSRPPSQHAAYPDTLVRTVHLPNGRIVSIRPIRPEDAAIERDFANGLSDQSKFQRLLYTARGISPEMLTRFTHIDYEREMALIAVQDTPQGEHEVGVARYAMLPDGRSCEFAIVVADDWQRQGLARQLMQSLIEAARDRGLEVMEGTTLRTNTGMRGLARTLGFHSGVDPDDPGLVRMRLVL